MTAFKAEYVDKKYIKTRLAYQLVFEVPAEQIDEADVVLGNLKGKQIWAAIARLKEPDGARESPVPEKPVSSQAEPPRPAPSDNNRWQTRAAMLCKDPSFQRWIGPLQSGLKDNEYHWELSARDLINARLGIRSRAELATNPEAQKKFLLLEAQYRAETGPGTNAYEDRQRRLDGQ
jgi:hypothetical protein